ncbi:MAG: hypothetical protein ACD_60C00037G0002 [uncultured bacterium]|nr:MAG: hypothetical protein ACD_60C00037G0002 [uncultured bacterium]
MLYKMISLLKMALLVGLLLITKEAAAGYYIVYAVPEVRACGFCESYHSEPHSKAQHKHHKQLHHKHSSYSISVYYGWYAYAGGVWVPSPCDCCNSYRQVYYQPNYYVEVSPEDADDYYGSSMDTDTADNDLE